MRWQRVYALVLAIGSVATAGSPAAAFALDLKSVEPQQVLSVRVESFREFPSAFARLTEYCATQEDIDLVSPHMSLGSGTDNLYAAVAFEGSPRTTSDVQILALPAATVAVAVHHGPYHFLPWSVKKLVSAAQKAGYTPDEKALLRLLHRNSPENTAPEDLITEIHLPVIRH